MPIAIRILDTSEVGRAHAWHSGFAAANDAILPRKETEFYDLALDRCLWCAITDEDELLAISYIHFSEHANVLEVGGVMVAAKTRSNGIGEAMMRVPLIHFLVNERPLIWTPSPAILSHVLAGNGDPRRIMKRCGFTLSRSASWSPEQLPGLRTGDDGMVHGDEFNFQLPAGLENMAAWVERWSGRLRDGSEAEIRLLEGETMRDWASILRSMM